MAYAQSYGVGPNAQYNYESMFRQGGYGGGGGGDYYSGSGPSNENYNMGVSSPYSPANNGGPGNPGTANNMPKPMLPRFQQFQNNKGPAPISTGPKPGNMYDMMNSMYDMINRASAGGATRPNNSPNSPVINRGNQAPPGYYEQGQNQLQQQWNALSPEERARYDQSTQQQMGGYNGSGINPQASTPFPNFAPPQGAGQFIPPGGNGGQYTMNQRQPYEQQRQTNNPLNQFGYGGQSPSLGRYIPPMMTNPGDVNAWNNQGGYAYNIPNSYGSGQWNQFNSRDVAFPSFGQSPNVPTPRLNPGNPPPSYQSPFGRPDPQRQQNYLAYMMNLAQGGQAQSNYTQPGAPDQPPPVV